MIQILTAIVFGIACAIMSVAIITVMPNEPILNWWFRLGYRLGIKRVGNEEVARWFYKPIWGCEKCFAGQLALWGFAAWHLRAGAGHTATFCHMPVYWAGFVNYSLFCHLTAICTAILTAVFFNHLIQKTDL